MLLAYSIPCAAINGKMVFSAQQATWYIFQNAETQIDTKTECATVSASSASVCADAGLFIYGDR